MRIKRGKKVKGRMKGNIMEVVKRRWPSCGKEKDKKTAEKASNSTESGQKLIYVLVAYTNHPQQYNNKGLSQ